MKELTIVTSTAGYGKYLREWAESITRLTRKPGAVAIFTHGSVEEDAYGKRAVEILTRAEISVAHEHSAARVDFGTARNRAVAMSQTEWVMHLDADDMIMPHALEDVAGIAPGADVVAMGYERSGDLKAGPSNRTRIYSTTTGLQALDAAAPCSGVSPFRRSFWERSPYRTDMLGAWDTALWIGFARLGARFRPTKRPCFWYRQHADSIFNQRRKIHDWTHVHTGKMLLSLRRNWSGVAVIVPLDKNLPKDRRAAWKFVREHYTYEHPDWEIVEGTCPTPDWSKGQAIADALSKTNAAVLIVADADCLVPGDALRSAVDRVVRGEVPWMVPHGNVLRLNRSLTARYLTDEISPLAADREEILRNLARPAYEGYAGGGIFVVRRVLYEAVGGIPAAFRGWGAEDQAIALIMDGLLGKHARGSADLFHLWHEPQLTRKTPGNNRLFYRHLKFAAKQGHAALFKAIHNLPGATFGKGLTEVGFKRRIREQEHASNVRARQSFLMRRKGKVVLPDPTPLAVGFETDEDNWETATQHAGNA